MVGFKVFLVLLLGCVLLLAVHAAPVRAEAAANSETRYLAFQIFTSSPDATTPISGSDMRPLGPIPAAQEIDALVHDIRSRIGTVGGGNSRLAMVLGPLSFDHTDADIRELIDTGFTLALKNDVAIGFHIDDSMFWARRKDLWSDPANIEWLDWDKTPNTGRRIDWGPKPGRIPPQMCFNSPIIEAEVRRRAAVIGKAIVAGQARLQKAGKEYLFAGVIAGWETMIGQDFATGSYLGYHALTNLGFSKTHTPTDPDAEREKVVHAFIDLWSQSLTAAGVSPSKIYSHVAFLSTHVFDQQSGGDESYLQHNHFAKPSTGFGPDHRPGFSTYPQPGLFDQIYAERNLQGRPGWASSEGTNLRLGTAPGQSGMNMETYLAKMFNHGATLVNIFSWGVGGEAHKNMSYRVVTEGSEALAAYRKFLGGEPLTEASVSNAPTLMERLPAKLRRIQAELPAWIQKTGGQAQAQPLLRQLDTALKANDFEKAETLADQILKWIEPAGATP